MWHVSFRDIHKTCFMSSYSHCMLAILRWRSWWNRWWSMTCFISWSAYDMFHVVIFTSSVGDTYLERELTSTFSCLNCNTLQHTATHCNTLQHTATHCNTLQERQTLKPSIPAASHDSTVTSSASRALSHSPCIIECCNQLQRVTVLQWSVCCSVLQCVAVSCSVAVRCTSQCVAVQRSVLKCVAVCCNVSQYVALCRSGVQ